MNIFHRHGLKWIIIGMLIFIPLVLLYGLEKQIKPLEGAFQSTFKDFQYKGSDDVWRNFDLNEYNETKVTGTYSFKTTLPENRWRDPYLYVIFIPNAEVYLDNKLIYTFEPNFEYWEHPHLIKLPDDFSGKSLMIRIDFDRQVMYPGLIMIDSPLNFVINFAIQSDYRLLLSIISFLLSLAGIIVYIGRREKSYLYFSLFALYIAQLCASRSWHLLGLLTSSPAFPYFQDVLLPIGGYFFLQFYEKVFRTGSKHIYRWLLHVMIIMFAVELIASIFFPSIYLNEMSFFLQNIIAPTALVLILISSVHTYWKRRDDESFWFMAAFVSFGLFTLLYFLIPYFLWIENNFASTWFPFTTFYKMMFEGDRFLHSTFILLFCMTMVLRARIRSIYDEAQKTAEELRKLSESLEQLVQERTKELEQTNRNLSASMQSKAEALAEIAVLEDRNRIAQDMHDHTGHALTAALIQIEAAKLLMNKDLALALAKLEASRESVASGLESIRETVRMMKLDYEERTLILSIQKLIEETRAAVGVEVIYDPDPISELDPISKKTLYLALQEGLTNGIRHGKATLFEFSLKEEGNTIYFQLANNGKPYTGQEFGFGLSTMRERIERSNGTMHLEKTDQHACVLHITLPIATNDEREGEQ